MSSKRIRRKDLLSGCSDVGPEDGLGPRYDRRGEPPAGDRKQMQLCGQVARTLASLFAGECGDEVLRDLLVESVVPAPSSARLLVTVALAPTAEPRPAGVIAERLERARGLLRSEVAAAVVRRRAPDLVFRVRARPDEPGR
jgi:ribosome-binding factor A